MINGFGDVAAIQKECEEFGAIHDGADMSRPEEIERMMKRCADELGGPDILVNNAGIQHVAPVQDFPPEKWDAIIAINLSSAFHTTRLAMPGMKQSSGAGSSTRRAPTASSPHPTRAPMSPPSTASPASPRQSRWKPRATDHRQLHFTRLCLDRLVERQIPDTMQTAA